VTDIARFLELAKKSPNALIMGQPVYDSSAPKSRLVGRKITNFWVMIETLNCNMPDTMCGFRVYPIDAVNKILSSVRFKRMGFDIEIVVKLYRAGVKIITTDTNVIYPESGVSHFRVWRDNFYISLMHAYLCFGLPMWLLQKFSKKIAKLFVIMFVLCGAANAKSISAMPDTLKTFTDNLGTVSATFTQSKTIPESVKTFRANGVVKFVRGFGFRWVQQKPSYFEFTSTLDSYCVNDEKQALAALPYFSQIQSMIDDVLNGDMTMFLMAFNADYTERKDGRWTLMATPKISAIAEFLSSITMAGNTTDLNQIVIIYKNGMTITIDFKRMKTDLPDAIKC
jgi:outer membrane lipoprotein-sorting protein